MLRRHFSMFSVFIWFFWLGCMCVCTWVLRSLEGRVGKLCRKFVLSKVNGQPGYRGDWIWTLSFFPSSNTAVFVLYNLVWNIWCQNYSLFILPFFSKCAYVIHMTVTWLQPQLTWGDLPLSRKQHARHCQNTNGPKPLPQPCRCCHLLSFWDLGWIFRYLS